MYQKIFERYEKKYLLTQEQLSLLSEFWKTKVIPDEYGSYTICNLYLDTDQDQIIRNSLEKPAYKEKIRLRSYGIPNSETTVFLELKKKYKDIVYKRRISLPYCQAKNYLYHHTPLPVKSQISEEIDWSMEFYKPTPKVMIAYDRIAFQGLENPELRITLDSNIRYRYTHPELSLGDWGKRLNNENMTLMEIKILGSFDPWLSLALSEFSIFPVSFSKYGACYQEYCIQKNQLGGMYCA